MKSSFLVCFLLFFFPLFTAGQVAELPFDSDLYVPLTSNYDNQLKVEMMETLNKNRQIKRLIRTKKACIGLVDLSDPSKPRFAHINGNHMMYAASLPKIAVLLAVEQELEKGNLQMTDDLDHHLSRMIAYSDNKSTTKLIDLVGFDKIASVLHDDRYNLYDEEKGGGIWVGKRYGKGGERKPDPLKQLSHAATATQVCRFYYMLAYGQLINCDRSIEMLKYLKDPMLHHKFVNVLDQVSPGADVFRKSGTWKNYHSDSVLVIGDQWRSYILVALVDAPNGGEIVKDIILKVDKLLEPKS